MTHAAIAHKLNEIETELTARGIAVPDSEAPAQVEGAFGSSAMPFEHWLARVFVPAARRAIATGSFPDQSQVGVAAVRNFDGRDEMGRLTELLGEFDALVDGPRVQRR
jgi:uncharacterized protein YqcC (DUF446 family)